MLRTKRVIRFERGRSNVEPKPRIALFATNLTVYGFDPIARVEPPSCSFACKTKWKQWKDWKMCQKENSTKMSLQSRWMSFDQVSLLA